VLKGKGWVYELLTFKKEGRVNSGSYRGMGCSYLQTTGGYVHLQQKVSSCGSAPEWGQEQGRA
jgi:hypothetical protein